MHLKCLLQVNALGVSPSVGDTVWAGSGNLGGEASLENMDLQSHDFKGLDQPLKVGTIAM